MSALFSQAGPTKRGFFYWKKEYYAKNGGSGGMRMAGKRELRRGSGTAAVYALTLLALLMAWMALMLWPAPWTAFASAPDVGMLPAALAWLAPQEASPADAWRILAAVCHAAGLGWMLLVQLCWRRAARYVRWPLERAVSRAKATYRLAMALVLLGEAALAWLMGKVGLWRMGGASWQAWAACVAPLALCAAGAAALCRLAAPRFISGRHAYFRRVLVKAGKGETA